MHNLVLKGEPLINIDQQESFDHGF